MNQQEPEQDQQNQKTELEHILVDVRETLLALLFKEKGYLRQLKLHHKIIFAFLVFFGLNLVWYGMWEIVSKLPILKNPVAALICGAIILIVTGYFYENLISVDFEKKKTLNRSNKK